MHFWIGYEAVRGKYLLLKAYGCLEAVLKRLLCEPLYIPLGYVSCYFQKKLSPKHQDKSSVTHKCSVLA